MGVPGGQIAENAERRPRPTKSREEASFEFSSRGQELSGVGLNANLLGDEVPPLPPPPPLSRSLSLS